MSNAGSARAYGAAVIADPWRGRGEQQDTGVKTPIYLDYQATTPVDPRVLQAMLPYFTHVFGNPHSRSHSYGIHAREAVEAARAEIAHSIGASDQEIIFTSGATEANNLAIKGAVRFLKDRGDHLVVSAIEHKCVLESANDLRREGFAVTVLPVDAEGLVDPDRLARAITPRTILVSVMAANNEIGVVQPLADIGMVCRKRGVLLHTDAAQAHGKIALQVDELGVDLMSLSAHKLYGPKGIGALYVRRRPRVRLAPLISGGGQERGLRSGTLPVPACVGFGEATRIAVDEMDAERHRLTSLRDDLWRRLQDAVPDARLNGGLRQRLASNLNVAFPGVASEHLLAMLPDLALSTGSACTSAAIEPSYVLRAIGIGDDLAQSSIRIGLGRFTTEAEVAYASGRIIEVVQAIRAGARGGSRRG